VSEGGLLTVGDVAKRWYLAPRTVRRYIEPGKLAAVKLPGGQWRIRPEDADAALGRG
jgi:excisionase family DNA binding protein